MRRLPLAALGVALLFLPPNGFAQTLLHLEREGAVSVTPSVLVVTIAADERAATPAEAQRLVNAAIAKALAQANAVRGLRVSSGSYEVFQPYQGQGIWEASQVITLRGEAVAVLLTLTGKLQGEGLALRGLAWEVSCRDRAAARERALALAIAALRAEAVRVAGLFGLRFERFREVTVGEPPVPMGPGFYTAAMAQAAAPMPPPSAQAGMVAITASVSATAELLPK